jgi:hypothetical protein
MTSTPYTPDEIILLRHWQTFDWNHGVIVYRIPGLGRSSSPMTRPDALQLRLPL